MNSQPQLAQPESDETIPEFGALPDPLQALFLEALVRQNYELAELGLSEDKL